MTPEKMQRFAEFALRNSLRLNLDLTDGTTAIGPVMAADHQCCVILDRERHGSERRINFELIVWMGLDLD